MASNDSKLSNSARNGEKKIRRQMAVFGGSGGFAAVSSQFLNNHHKSNCNTKAHCCNSFFGWVHALVLMVSKSGTSAPPLSYNFNRLRYLWMLSSLLPFSSFECMLEVLKIVQIILYLLVEYFQNFNIWYFLNILGAQIRRFGETLLSYEMMKLPPIYYK